MHPGGGRNIGNDPVEDFTVQLQRQKCTLSTLDIVENVRVYPNPSNGNA
jgi:hypothetical protein